MKLPVSLLLLPLTVALARAQVFDAGDNAGGGTGPGSSNNTTVINNGGQPSKPKSFLGEDVPFMDPGSETAQWATS